MAEHMGVRKTRTGVVLKKSSDKSIVVQVERRFMHPRFKKYVRQRKKYHVHDPRNEAALGDKVEIIESRPISKMKKWVLRKVIMRGQGVGEGVG